MPDDIGPQDAGKQVTGQIQAAQSRTRGKFGGRTAAERAERLRLGREAATNLVRGTIQKNRSEFTPLPETELIDGKITDIGYDPDDWAEFERESRTYERQAMEAIKQDKVKVDWEQYYLDEFKSMEPSFLQAAYRAIAPNAKEVLTNVGKAVPAGVAGAPADLAVMSWHTLKWIANNRNMINANDYGFIKDFPEFKNIPGTSDYIAQKYFDADVDTMSFTFGSLLSPDPASVGKLAGVFGGPIAFARQVKKVETSDPKRAQYLISNFEEARTMDSMGGNTEEIYQRTGWFKVGKDWRFLMDVDNAQMSRTTVQTKLKEAVQREMEQVDELTGLSGGQVAGRISLKLGEIFDHPSFYDSYPELADMNIGVHVIPNPNGVMRGLEFNVGSTRYVVRGDGVFTPEIGAAFIPGTNVGSSTIDIFGTESVNAWKRFQESLVHEVEHFVQSIEGFSRGGNSDEFRRMAPILTLRSQNAQLDVFEAMTEGSLDIEDTQAVGEFLFDFHGSYLNEIPEADWDTVAEAIQRKVLFLSGDAVEEELWRMDIKDAKEQFAQFLKYYKGTEETGDLDEVIRTMDLGLVPSIANDIYFSLEGEGMSRLAEAVWRNRKNLPEDFDPASSFMRKIKQDRIDTVEGPMEGVPGGPVRIEQERQMALE
jgi:hypothetical protein